MPSSSIQNQIIQEANSQGIPSSIALGVAQQESGFNPNAVGSSGELGVFQLLPSSFPGQPISDTNSNITIGISYLKQLYNQFGDWVTALAAYNAGPGNVSNGIIPASTQNYVSSVLANAAANDPTVTVDDGDSTSLGVRLCARYPSLRLKNGCGQDDLSVELFAIGGATTTLRCRNWRYARPSTRRAAYGPACRHSGCH